jgi:hypothetical protein
MTQLNNTPGAQKIPCHSCSASAEALGLLSMSLQTAIQAAQYIRIPLPGKFKCQTLGALLIGTRRCTCQRTIPRSANRGGFGGVLAGLLTLWL